MEPSVKWTAAPKESIVIPVEFHREKMLDRTGSPCRRQLVAREGLSPGVLPQPWRCGGAINSARRQRSRRERNTTMHGR